MCPVRPKSAPRLLHKNMNFVRNLIHGFYVFIRYPRLFVIFKNTFFKLNFTLSNSTGAIIDYSDIHK